MENSRYFRSFCSLLFLAHVCLCQVSPQLTCSISPEIRASCGSFDEVSCEQRDCCFVSGGGNGQGFCYFKGIETQQSVAPQQPAPAPVPQPVQPPVQPPVLPPVPQPAGPPLLPALPQVPGGNPGLCRGLSARSRIPCGDGRSCPRGCCWVLTPFRRCYFDVRPVSNIPIYPQLSGPGGVVYQGGQPGFPGNQATLSCAFLPGTRPRCGPGSPSRFQCGRWGCCWISGACYQPIVRITYLRNRCPPGQGEPPACEGSADMDG